MKGNFFFLKIIGMFFFMLNCLSISAQTKLPYFEGFEGFNRGSTEHSTHDEWKLVNGSNTNKWHFGNATAAEGSQSLYVSSENGFYVSYSDNSCGIGVYKEFDLPVGNYEVSFDYKLQGEYASDGEPIDGLYVCWVTLGSVNISPSSGGIAPALKTYRKTITRNDYIEDANMWHHCDFNITVAANHSAQKLVFYWINDGSGNYPPPACIDNVQISQIGSPCDKPTSLETSFKGGFSLSWQADAPKYEIKYKNELTQQWVEIQEEITSTSYMINGIDKGIYTFWVRGICGTDTSAWAVKSNVILAVSSDDCLNFVDIDNEDNCIAKFGTNAIANVAGVRDYGNGDPESRHTIHFKQGEYDPRTKYGNDSLRTIPKNGLASVRLGGWAKNAYCQSLSYSYTVTAANSILILKYATVFENLDHDKSGDDTAQPRFMLLVTDDGDIPLDQVCTQAIYLASSNLGWNRIPQGGIPGHFEILWKNWTTLGINLERYIGRKVKVYIETGDCYPLLPPATCMGYGYFTLDCAPARLSGLTCGSKNSSTGPQEPICAPEGFAYRWYKASDPSNIVETNQCFTPTAGDTDTYICEMIMDELGKESCSFFLYASLLPRDPVAEASWTACQKTVQFFDESYVTTEKGIVEGEQCDVYWWFEDRDSISYERNPVYEFKEPGTWKVILNASITGGDNVCDSIWEGYVTVSEDTVKVELNENICYKGTYLFNGRVLTQPGVYVDTIMTNHGCDSIVTLYLDMPNTIEYDTICGGQEYEFEGEVYNFPEGLNELKYKKVISVTGCDSILSLFVAPPVSFEPVGEMCADQEHILFNVTAGIDSVLIEYIAESAAHGYMNSTVLVTDNTFEVPLPENAYAGICTGKFTFYSSYCGTSILDFTFNVKYPETIIAQRWNDVLAIKSKSFNGGYDFIGYQWYRNGEKLDGETKSYLFIPEGLNPEDRYSAELVRSQDNITMLTCEIIPEDLISDLTLIDNKVQVNQNYTIKSAEEGIVRLYTVTGNLISEHKLSAGTNQLRAPNAAGYYLLRVQTSEQEKTFYLNVTQ